jgi:DNA (cytosine-5)-methyltransferase 1
VRLRELSLFAGIGGGILGLRDFTSPVVAVEISPFCRKVLERQQHKKRLDAFPIWDDITTFNSNRWKNRVDIITGGFPCQAFSTATHGALHGNRKRPSTPRGKSGVSVPMPSRESG